MPTVAAILAPLVLLLLGAPPAPAERDGAEFGPESPVHAQTLSSAEQNRWRAFEALQSQPLPQQVRIEQRIVVRVTPARPRNASLPELPRNFPDRFSEKKMGKCVPLQNVAAVQTGGPSKLILFLRDRSIVSAELEKACSARDFYSGFYVEARKDGQLCIDRDELQSRTGAKCELSRFRRLVLTGN